MGWPIGAPPSPPPAGQSLGLCVIIRGTRLAGEATRVVEGRKEAREGEPQQFDGSSRAWGHRPGPPRAEAPAFQAPHPVDVSRFAWKLKLGAA